MSVDTMILKILLTTILILSAIGLFFYCFPICKINGESMYPTFKDGELYLCQRFLTEQKKRNLEMFKVYIYDAPDNEIVIKRLHYRLYRNGVEFYFIGDNKDNSLDSREYGYVKSERIIGRPLFKIKSVKESE